MRFSPFTFGGVIARGVGDTFSITNDDAELSDSVVSWFNDSGVAAFKIGDSNILSGNGELASRENDLTASGAYCVIGFVILEVINVFRDTGVWLNGISVVLLLGSFEIRKVETMWNVFLIGAWNGSSFFLSTLE